MKGRPDDELRHLPRHHPHAPARGTTAGYHHPTGGDGTTTMTTTRAAADSMLGELLDF